MRPLIANLKILYQRLVLGILHIVFILVFFGIALENEFESGDYTPIAFIILFYFAYGGILGIISVEVMSKPFSFCLSGRIKAAQNMLLVVSVSLTVLFLLFFGKSLLHNPANDYSILMVFTSLIIMSYWAGVFIVSQKRWDFVILLILMLFFTFNGSKDKAGFIEPVAGVLEYPWAVFSVCIILSYFIYHAAGNKKRIRGSFDNPAKSMKPCFFNLHPSYLQDEGMFSGPFRINTDSKLSGLLRHQFYLLTGQLKVYWKRILLVSFWMGFLIFDILKRNGNTLDSIGVEVVVLASASLLFCIYFQNNSSYFFILVERKEYFQRRIVLLLIKTLGFTFFISICIFICSQFLKYFAPFPFKLLVVPIIMVPLFGGFTVLLKKEDFPIRISFMLTVIALTGLFSYIVFTKIAAASLFVQIIIILACMAITWGFHIGVLYYDSMKRSLC